MFNWEDYKTLRGDTRTEYVPYEKSVKIIEKRAPTDESIALLKEYQEKALKSILDSVHINSNDLSGFAIYTADMFTSGAIDNLILMKVQFILNGKKYSAELDIKKSEYQFMQKEERRSKLAKFLIDTISRKIAAEIIKNTGTDWQEPLRTIL